MKRGRHIAAPLIALLLLASTGLAETMHLDTTVTYRERIVSTVDAIAFPEMSMQATEVSGCPRTSLEP